MTLINMTHSDKLSMSHLNCLILHSFIYRFPGSLFVKVTCLHASNDQNKRMSVPFHWALLKAY